MLLSYMHACKLPNVEAHYSCRAEIEVLNRHLPRQTISTCGKYLLTGVVLCRWVQGARQLSLPVKSAPALQETITQWLLNSLAGCTISTMKSRYHMSLHACMPAAMHAPKAPSMHFNAAHSLIPCIRCNLRCSKLHQQGLPQQA